MSLNISNNSAVFVASSHLSKSQASTQNSIKKLASGKRNINALSDPGMLSVSMKLKASATRLSGVSNNIQNAISFLEVQDGMLETAGRILNRMAEIKGMVTADPMKSEQDLESYDNEIKQLQVQMYQISQQTFNGVSLFANRATENDGTTGSTEAIFNAQNQALDKDNTIEIFTSGEGATGSKVSIHKSLLLSALTVTRGLSISKTFSSATNTTAVASMSIGTVVTFASDSTSGTLDLDKISVGVITKVLENIAYLRAQSGGSQSRLAFNLESLGQQKTNMRAALGRIVDVDIAEESMNLAKYSILNQAAASMLAQANASSDVALMLLR